ncbi:GUN4 domain protein [Gloeothece citriformis PCC 7424]|uniref:GUN4 domain protein n=1 Tax=Gloeothece citriformis (strain PCC 7424) TaxID=65393 RepID=B7KJQ8_GLOC7|nr:GUN4 domain-containing protein [Gloeothece citriformis]ACK69507.1 GUN4 domain protein [Gloeothece citriformis PCC 7424]
MTNWAWVIGLNHYHRLQSLRGAIRDAELIRDFCLESNFEQIFYYSDNSPDLIAPNGSRQATQPTYTNLKAFLLDFFDSPQLQAGDNFWFFFSGHGVRHQGRDYLMPCDAHPLAIEDTALSLNYITETLRRSGADNIILLLDACRNDESRNGLGIGGEKHQGVITISSCSPSEKSYEIPLSNEIFQGSFTTALLEGLRIRGEGNCATVERLYQHLTYRVPQINQQYKKPPQFPYLMAEPPSKMHYILLPQNATLRDAEPLRKEALKAEVKEDYQLARQLWIRVLEVSWRDYEAIEGIERIARKILTQPQQVPIPPTPSLSDAARGLQPIADKMLTQPKTEKPQPFFLQDSPLAVCSYLNEVGLKTRDYKDLLGDGNYSCSSPYQELGEKSSGLKNNIAYYVSGSLTNITELKIVLNVNQPNQAQSAHQTMVNYGNILLKKAIGMNFTQEILKALELGTPNSWNFNNYTILVIREDWINGKGYEIKLIIKSKNITDKSVLSSTGEIEFKSEKGVDYTQLRDFLKQGKWKEADQETSRVMCQAANRTSEGWLRVEDINNFPCEDLRTINQLWLHYSKGKFGFSVQAEIYHSLGGTREYNREIWEKFCDRVGWRKEGDWLCHYDLTFSLEDAPRDHLPGFGAGVFWSGDVGAGAEDVWLWCGMGLFSRVKTCNL